MNEDLKQRIRIKLKLNLKLTMQERAYYLLFIASNKEVKKFLKREKKSV